MKKAIFTTIFISSITIFSGCSTSQPEANKKIKKEAKALEVEKLIGINTGREDIFIVQNEPIEPSYHFVVDNSYSYNNIETHPAPKYEYIQNQAPAVSEDIEIVSYGLPMRDNPIYQNSYDKIKALEEDAKSFLGTKYVWGATGPNKFDCSGFTQWVFRDIGIDIPRVSRDQAKVGEYVTFENLRKGDMVFFDTRKKKRGVVTHVGIYLGDGNFIHASSRAKKVVVYNFKDKPYYRKRFLWGRRVINTNNHYASNY